MGNQFTKSTKTTTFDESTSKTKNVKLVLLEPAPRTIKPPIPNTKYNMPQVKPVMDNAFMDDQNDTNYSSPNKMYEVPSMDQVARNLALGDARPAKWGDLYWHLIASRELQTDMEKINALFTWLCSIPTERDEFVNFKELKQGVDEGVEHAVEALQTKPKINSLDSPEEVMNRKIECPCFYIQAFESICRYAGIPCFTIQGWAKDCNYSIGMKLNRTDLKHKLTNKLLFSQSQHLWNAAYVDGRWGLFDPVWAIENNKGAIAMFYFNSDPSVFIHSHYPLEEKWQLLVHPVTLDQFSEGIVFQPGFFTHGFGVLSHKKGIIRTAKSLNLILSVSPTLVNDLSFGFVLEQKTNIILGKKPNLSQCGTHEVSKDKAIVTFNFRFPRCQSYNLTITVKTPQDIDFIDVCKYLVLVTDKKVPRC